MQPPIHHPQRHSNVSSACLPSVHWGEKKISLVYVKHPYSFKQWSKSTFILVAVGAGSILLAFYHWESKVKKAKQPVHGGT